MKINTI